MGRGNEHASDGGARGNNARENELPSEWTPPKKPVPIGKPKSALSQVRAKALAEMGAMIERLEQAVRQQPPVDRGEKQLAGEPPDPRQMVGQAVGQAPPVEQAEPGVAGKAQDPGLVLEQLCQRLEGALVHLDSILERLALLAHRLEEQPEQSGALPEPVPSLAAPTTIEEQAFLPGKEAVTIVLAPVSDFHDLMEMHRALSRLPAAEGASVIRYQNGEASFELLLRTGVSASQIVAVLGESTGRRPLIEESKPDAARLRLHFVDQESPARNSGPAGR